MENASNSIEDLPELKIIDFTYLSYFIILFLFSIYFLILDLELKL